MAGIDDVIARSRQAGGFVERKRFAVARSRAIEKMRRFALADPYFYILELIQGAVANGANYVDIELARKEVTLSYVGGGFGADELGQLFDFLFASKENLDYADVRQFALGLNALLLAQPDEIVIESGDGRTGRTTRVRIDGRSEAVEVGKPGYDLRGTFLRISGLDRGRLGARDGFGERGAIESRCLTAPVPIVVNSEPVFGYGRARTPRLLGFGRTLSFDEGDLYGTIGLAAAEADEMFRLLTWGVWVDAVRAGLLPGVRLGGIVGFDRLHKTADHAAIVQDERLQELWTRLRPYARMLLEGRKGAATHEMWDIDGRPLRTSDIRETFRTHPTVVAAPRHGPGATGRARRAAAIGAALQIPVILLGGDDAAALRLLGGPGARVVQPDLSSDEDVAFYQRPPADPPERPWLIAPVEIEPLPVEQLGQLLEQEGRLATEARSDGRRGWQLLRQLGTAGDVHATIYVPENIAPGVELWAETLVTGRRLISGNMSSPYPGFVLRIELPDVSPQRYLQPWPGAPDATCAGFLTLAVARHVSGVLETAARRVLAGIGQLPVAPGSAAARIALAALARSAILRLRREPSGATRLRFALLDPALPDALLEVPLLRTLDGRGLSLHGLEELTEATGGLVYGSIPDVPADLQGLDRSRILDLDVHQERMLLLLLGDAGYVRVDAREVLAEHDGVRCRDVAFGLRPYGNFPLLVEGSPPGGLTPDLQAACEQRLVRQLVEEKSGGDPERQRQASKHLAWYLYRKVRHGLGAREDFGVSRLPLFRDVSGRLRSFAELRGALCSSEGLCMRDGWAHGSTGAAPPPNADDAPPDGAAPAVELAMDPFALHVLAGLGTIRPAFDFDLSDAEAVADPAPPMTAYAASVTIDDEAFTGTIGVPLVETAGAAIVVVNPAQRRLMAIRDLARKAGVVGRLVVRMASVPGGLLRVAVERAIGALRVELARRIAALPPEAPERERCIRAGLRLAEQAVVLVAEPDGTVAVDLADGSARRLLELPLFSAADGTAVSAWRLVREFAAACSGEAAAAPRTALAADAPAYLREWLDAVCRAERIVRPAHAAAPAVPPPPAAGTTPADLGAWLSAALRRIHREAAIGGDPPEVTIARPGPREARRGLALIRLPHPESLPDRNRLVLDAEHWLVERTRQRLPQDEEAAAWLLLATYAQLNADLDAIGNQAELDFQARLLDLLESGGLLQTPQTP
jgi:hypothetical protein